MERTKRYMERDAEILSGSAAAFANRIDRGWVPPTLDDVEAVIEEDEAARAADS